MSELPEDLQRLLRAARREEDPSEEDRHAVRRAVAARLVAAAAGTTATLVTKTAVAKGWIVAGYVAAGVALGGAVSVGVVVATSRPPAAPAVVPTRPRVPVATRPVPQRAVEPAPVASAELPAPTAALRPVPSTAVRQAPSLQEETQALVEVQRALRDGQPERALRLLDEQDRSFQNGALGEERAAAHILSLCAAGRVADARVAADRFLAAHPTSPVAARVRTSCVEK